MDVTLLTPTADRPKAMALCERWVHRTIDRATQDNPEIAVEWVVSDGGTQPAVLAPHPIVQHLRNDGAGSPVRNFHRNLVAGLEASRGDFVLFIEDDDWYAPEWLCMQYRWLQHYDIVGEARAKYYHLASRQYEIHANTLHASLCQTGIRRELIPGFVDQIHRTRSPYVDLRLWRNVARTSRRFLAPRTSLCVGMKGLAGKPGIGKGHWLSNHAVDHDGSVLRHWVGDDAVLYERWKREADNAE